MNSPSILFSNILILIHRFSNVSRIMFLHFGFCLLRYSTAHVLYHPAVKAVHDIISTCLYTENTCVLSQSPPALCVRTLSHTVAANENKNIGKYTVHVDWFPSIHPCDQTGDRWIQYQGSHLFWNQDVGAATRCKNNVVSEAKP